MLNTNMTVVAVVVVNTIIYVAVTNMGILENLCILKHVTIL
jgi:hypothetical protein